jgi:hypothetical protein
MKVIALDPGPTTGVVVYDDELDQLSGFHVDMDGLMTYLLMQKSVDVYVFEEFRLYPWLAKQQAFSEFESAQIIGMLRILAKARNIRLVKQTASARKMSTEAMIESCLSGKETQIEVVNENQHSRDALHHLVVFLATERNKQRELQKEC